MSFSYAIPLVLGLGGMILAYAIFRGVERMRESSRRMELIEKALQSGQLDPDMRRELAKALKPATGGLSKLIFSAGWLGIFGFGTMLALDPPRQEFFVALFGLVMSFGVVTLPLALREVEARRNA